MIVSVASMKGGVGKSTLSAMLAKVIAEQRGTPVTVVDLDPQRGATILLLGADYARRHVGPGIYEILESELQHIPSTELLRQAIRTSPYNDLIRIIPSDASLARLRGPETPRDLLKVALQDAPFNEDETIIIDTSPDVTFCETGITASDLVFIPITMSHQSGIPTLNTIQAVLNAGKRTGGLIPTLVGRAQWQDKRVKSWRKSLTESELLQGRGIPVLPAMKFSHAIPSGKWRWGSLPVGSVDVMDALIERIFENSEDRKKLVVGEGAVQ